MLLPEADSFYANPNFCVPATPNLDSKKFGIEGEVEDYLAEAVEARLVEVDIFDTQSALALQLEHATALATVGNYERAEFHFRRVLSQVELNRGAIALGDGDETLGDLPLSQLLRAKAVWFMGAAKAIGLAGFLELSDEAMTSGVAAINDLNEAETEPWGQPTSPEAVIKLAGTLIDLGQYEIADKVLEDLPSDSRYLEKMLNVKHKTAEHYLSTEDYDGFERIRLEKIALVDEVELEIKGHLADTSQPPPISETLYWLKMRTKHGDQLSIQADIKEIVDTAKTRLNSINQDCAQFAISEACALAEITYASGDPEAAQRALEKALGLEELALAMSDAHAEFNPTDLAEIAAAYAKIDDYTTSDSLIEGLSPGLGIDVLRAQMRQADETGNTDRLATVLPRLGKLLDERLKQTDGTDDFLARQNLQFIELASIYKKHGQDEALSELFNKIMNVNQHLDWPFGDEYRQSDLLIFGDEHKEADLVEVASHLRERGMADKDLTCFKLMSTQMGCRFLIRLLKDSAKKPDER